MGQPASVFTNTAPSYLATVAALLGRLEAIAADAKRDLDPEDYEQFRNRAQTLMAK